MIESFLKFHELINSNTIKFIDKTFHKVIQDYSFIHISIDDDYYIRYLNQVFQNINKSNIMIINECCEDDQPLSEVYLIIGFYKTIIFINKLMYLTIEKFLTINQSIFICNISNNKAIFNQIKNIRNKQIVFDPIFKEEIQNFNRRFQLEKTNDASLARMWRNTRPCITGYLIKESYYEVKNQQKQLKLITQRVKPYNFQERQYISLRTIDFGSTFVTELIYHIEMEKIFIIKKPISNKLENTTLVEREIMNYQSLNYPLIPKFFGTVSKYNYPIIEYIEGQTLSNISKLDFNFNDRITIIFELLMIINYLHENGFVYRDLKPDNIIINEYKIIYLIDFDRMIKLNMNQDKSKYTADFSSSFVAPEVNFGHISYKNDIYSLGKMISYIMLNGQNCENITSNKKYHIIQQICEKCTKYNIDERPSISDIIFIFYNQFRDQIDHSKIPNDNFIDCIKELLKYEPESIIKNIDKAIHYYSLAANQNDPQAQFYLGLIYSLEAFCSYDIHKAIHYLSLAANQNHLEAQFTLGQFYHEGEYVIRDINKAIYYYLLAANQNHSDAQGNLGLIYYEGRYITRDINKAFHYFSLAANQNDPQAQFNLGVIYYEGIYVTRDINKAIHYFSLVANQNDPQAQYNLGVIYREGKYVARNINKAIHYYSLAANQNHPQAQCNLGLIYCEGEFVKCDINKAIHYLSLAANQNHPQAQYNLGVIYHEGIYVTRDIDQAIHYYSLAANQNHPHAQYNLGIIYYEGRYVTRDINKAIHYFSLAANQNYPDAQYNLGLIYSEGEFVKRDISKAIHYLSFAANQNYPDAQYNLGLIYYEGKYVTFDINKAIHYLSLAANQNIPEAQFNLGIIYYKSKGNLHNIKKSRYYIMLSSMNGLRVANFAHGFILQEGKCVERNIEEAIHYYKEASSFNIGYAKNNLGIIYKHGYGNVEGRAGNAIVYFEEAIRQTNDYLSMYNLAHIYIYDETIKQDISKSIELLIRSSHEFSESKILLCLALIKQKGFNMESIKNVIMKIVNPESYLFKIMCQMIEQFMFDKWLFSLFYEEYRTHDYLYNAIFDPIKYSDLYEKDRSNIQPKYPNAKNISSMFYEGFGVKI